MCSVLFVSGFVLSCSGCSGLACSGLFGAGALGALCARVGCVRGWRSAFVLCVRLGVSVRSCVRAFVRSCSGGCCSGLVLFGVGAVRGWCVRCCSGGWVGGGWRVGAHARAGWFYTERGLRSPPLARMSAVGRCLDLSRVVGCRVLSGSLSACRLFGAQKCSRCWAGAWAGRVSACYEWRAIHRATAYPARTIDCKSFLILIALATLVAYCSALTASSYALRAVSASAVALSACVSA